jgi:hypothetical protein
MSSLSLDVMTNTQVVYDMIQITDHHRSPKPSGYNASQGQISALGIAVEISAVHAQTNATEILYGENYSSSTSNLQYEVKWLN